MKKKILLGICGIGNGHTNRQRCIIEELLKLNVEIVLVVTKSNLAQFNKLFPHLKKVVVHIPWIFCNEEGVEFVKTLKRYKIEKVDYYKTFLESSIKIIKSCNGLPDLIFTDYEPNTAQFAYATGRPLICLEQQSKFLNLPTTKINNFSPVEEISRLSYFFPKAQRRYVSSFFPIKKNNKNNLVVIHPILKKISRKKVCKNKGLVYFSPYSRDRKMFTKILFLIRNYPDIEFAVYTDLKFNSFKKYKNIRFKPIGKTFEHDIVDCKFIISSSGHQLISESIQLEIPIYVFPFRTFEQNFNASQVEKFGLGKIIKRCDMVEFGEFLNELTNHKENMHKFKIKYWKSTWDKELIYRLKKELNL